MVAERAEGTRRIYCLQERGIEAVREYLERIWGDAATRFRLLAENTEGARAGARASGRRRVHDRPAADVVRHGVLGRARIHRLDLRDRHVVPADHTVTGRDDITVVMQSGVGGRIYERTSEEVEHDWGR